jgi:Cdc6-like AAA superfamily ATPase
VELVPNTNICYVLYKVVKPITPLEVLVSLMATTYADWSAIKSVSNLYAHLENKGHFIIFFIDELDAVFAGDGVDIVNQLLAR